MNEITFILMDVFRIKKIKDTQNVNEEQHRNVFGNINSVFNKLGIREGRERGSSLSRVSVRVASCSFEEGYLEKEEEKMYFVGNKNKKNKKK